VDRTIKIAVGVDPVDFNNSWVHIVALEMRFVDTNYICADKKMYKCLFGARKVSGEIGDIKLFAVFIDKIVRRHLKRVKIDKISFISG